MFFLKKVIKNTVFCSNKNKDQGNSKNRSEGRRDKILSILVYICPLNAHCPQNSSESYPNKLRYRMT